MGLFDRFRRSETRAVPAFSSPFMQAIGLDLNQAAGVVVTHESAMRVPAVACAVNFIAETMASLPLDYYRRKRDGSRELGKGPLQALIHDAAHPALTSYEWRKGLIVAKLTGGRGFTYIERNERGIPVNFWPLDPCRVVVKRDGFALSYEYQTDGRRIVYAAAEIIDVPFMLKPDGLCHWGPLQIGRDAIALAIAANKYGEKFFSGGGVPPFVITGNFQSASAMQRASDDLAAAVKKASKEERLALTLPAGLDIKPLGSTPDKGQFIELKRFQIEEIARIYSIPPTFLQDLTHGTYSNTEQQDLHFVKHTLLHHVKQFEQELNLKLFGRANRSEYIEFNVDGIMRGDFKARMEGWARAIQTGINTPNEAREAENWTALPGGDQLFMQGATVPIDQAGTTPAASNGAGA